MSKFSVRFKELKDKSHLTLKDISDELGISVSNLSYYMKGREPNYDSLCDIADYFEVTTDYLLGRTDYRTYEEELQVKSTQELNEDDKTDLTQITQLTESLKKKLIPLLVDDVNNRQEIIDIVDEFIDLICYLIDLKPLLYEGYSNTSKYFKSNNIAYDATISAYSTLISLNGTIKDKLFKFMCEALGSKEVSESQKRTIFTIFEGLCVDTTFYPSPGRTYHPIK